MSDVMIETSGLRKAFGSLEVLRGVDLRVGRGEVVCVIGPSGSGKSTLLRCVNLLEEPTEGKVVVDGAELTDPDADLDAARRHIGMVFQQFNLFSHLTVVENLTVAQRKVLRRGRTEAERIARENLARVGLSEKERAMPAQLSGGQQQRVAIARALAMNPHVMLFDEPTSALDPKAEHALFERIRRHADGRTVLLITHRLSSVRYADRIYVLNRGRVSEQGTHADLVLADGEYARLYELQAAAYREREARPA